MEKLKSWLAWLRENKENWPVLVSIVLFGLNVELVVTPYILDGLMGLSGRKLRLTSGAWSTPEMCWWIFFSIWIAREKMKSISKLKLGDIFKPVVDDYWLLARAKDIFSKHVIEKFDLENYKSDKFFKALSDSLRNYGYPINWLFIFVFSLVPGYWIIALMVCRITKWTSLYLVLLAGNFLKNYFFAYVYELVGFWNLLVLTLAILFFTGYIIKKTLMGLGPKL